jgi:hypothetical protein
LTQPDTHASVRIANPAALYACALHQSKDPLRPYIGGVLIEPHPAGGALLVATDGHRLSLAYDGAATLEGVGPSGILLPVGPITTTALTKKRVEEVEWLTLSGQPVWRASGSATTLEAASPIGGVFPNWRRLMTWEPTGVSGHGFDPKYLALYERLAKVAGSGCVRITPNGDAPALVALAGVSWWRGILMPKRWDADASHRPDWAV